VIKRIISWRKPTTRAKFKGKLIEERAGKKTEPSQKLGNSKHMWEGRLGVGLTRKSVSKKKGHKEKSLKNEELKEGEGSRPQEKNPKK